MAAHGHFHWNELLTRDFERAKAFYEAVIGWRFEAMPMPEGGPYWVAWQGDVPVAGMMDISDLRWSGVPANWFAYLAVDDVDARLAEAERHGATVHRRPFDVPGVGRIAILEQPDGAAIGWMTPAASAPA
ncbi:VOC family protein [Faunimonas sp. B44]|uniref:VOC family protein n=1 Tax=Faunimonas sp. B44 TaxID=3461493 RepID=UPI0040450400